MKTLHNTDELIIQESEYLNIKESCCSNVWDRIEETQRWLHSAMVLR